MAQGGKGGAAAQIKTTALARAPSYRVAAAQEPGNGIVVLFVELPVLQPEAAKEGGGRAERMSSGRGLTPVSQGCCQPGPAIKRTGHSEAWRCWAEAYVLVCEAAQPGEVGGAAGLEVVLDGLQLPVLCGQQLLRHLKTQATRRGGRGVSAGGPLAAGLTHKAQGET